MFLFINCVKQVKKLFIVKKNQIIFKPKNECCTLLSHVLENEKHKANLNATPQRYKVTSDDFHSVGEGFCVCGFYRHDFYEVIESYL